MIGALLRAMSSAGSQGRGEGSGLVGGALQALTAPDTKLAQVPGIGGGAERLAEQDPTLQQNPTAGKPSQGILQMFTNASPEKRQEIILEAETEAQEKTQNVEKAKELAAEAEVTGNVKEAVTFYNENREELQQPLQQAVVNQLGIDVDQITREAVQATQEIIADVNKLNQGMELEANSILAKRLSGKELDENERTGLLLVSAIPLMMGMMMGGRKGLLKGLTAAMQGTGQFLQQREANASAQEQQSFDNLMGVRGEQRDLQNTKLGAAQLLTGQAKDLAATEAAKGGAKAQKSPFTEFGYEIDSPELAASAMGDAVSMRKLRDAVGFNKIAVEYLDEMQEIIEKEGVQLTEFSEAGKRLGLISGQLLNVGRKVTDAGANFTDMEMTIQEIMSPIMTGLKSKWLGNEFGIERIQMARAAYAKNVDAGMTSSGFKSTKKQQKKQVMSKTLKDGTTGNFIEVAPGEWERVD